MGEVLRLGERGKVNGGKTGEVKGWEMGWG